MKTLGSFNLKDYQNNWIGYTPAGILAIDHPKKLPGVNYDFFLHDFGDGKVALTMSIPGAPSVTFASIRDDYYGFIRMKAPWNHWWVTEAKRDELLGFYYTGGNSDEVAFKNFGGYLTPLYNIDWIEESFDVDGQTYTGVHLGVWIPTEGIKYDPDPNTLLSSIGPGQRFKLISAKPGNVQAAILNTLLPYPDHLTTKVFPNATFDHTIDTKNQDMKGFSFPGSTLSGLDLSPVFSIENMDLTDTKLINVNMNRLFAAKVNFTRTEIRDSDFHRIQLIDCVNLQTSKWYNTNLSDLWYSSLDFRGAYFEGCTLSPSTPRAPSREGTPGLFLSGATLKNCDLRGLGVIDNHISFHKTKLDGSNLQGCSLNGTDFTDASWAGVNFTGVDLTTCIWPSARPLSNDPKQPTIFTRATLKLSDLGMNWANIVLSDAKIPDFATQKKGAFKLLHAPHVIILNLNMNGTEPDINFSGKDLSRANFNSARLQNLNFEGANLTGASFTTEPGSQSLCTCTNVQFNHAVLSKVQFDRALLTTCQLDNIVMETGSFKRATLGGRTNVLASSMTFAYLANVSMQECDLSNVNLGGCTFWNASQGLFQGALMEGANLTAAFLVEVDFSGAFLNAATFDDANLVKARFLGTDLSPGESGSKGASFRNACMQGVTFGHGTNLRGVDLDTATFAFQDGVLKTKYRDAQGEIIPPGHHWIPFSYSGNTSNTLSLAQFDSSTVFPNGETYAVFPLSPSVLKTAMTAPVLATEWEPDTALHSALAR